MENIINNGTPVTIGEQTFTLRRLNTFDVITVATVLGKVYDADMINLDEGQEAKFVSYILSAIPVAKDDIVGLLADMIGLSVDEFYALPPEALFIVAQALSESEDLKRFFETVKTMFQKMMASRQR